MSTRATTGVGTKETPRDSAFTTPLDAGAIPQGDPGNGGRSSGQIIARRGRGTKDRGTYTPRPRAASLTTEHRRMAGELYPTNQWAAPMPPPTQSANLPVPTGWGHRNFSQQPGTRG